MAEIVIAEFMDEAAVAGLAAGFTTLYAPDLVDRPDDLLAAVPACRALIVRNRTQVRGPLLDAAGRLQVVGRLGVGLDNIDLDRCRSRGIAVRPAVGANELAVAEYVITAALVLLRGCWSATAAMIAGEWPRGRLSGHELAGKAMGLVGLGAIGRQVAARAGALGMRVAAFDPYLAAEDPAWSSIDRHEAVESLLAAADVLSLHVPLSEGTRHLVGSAALARMKAGAVLINAARGGIVDEPAVAQALREGRLGGAALDVFETEPLTATAGEVFAGCPNLILTPHIAGVTAESNVRVSATVAAAVREVLGPG